jgi:hypothetical protein
VVIAITRDSLTRLPRDRTCLVATSVAVPSLSV